MRNQRSVNWWCPFFFLLSGGTSMRTPEKWHMMNGKSIPFVVLWSRSGWCVSAISRFAFLSDMTGKFLQLFWKQLLTSWEQRTEPMGWTKVKSETVTRFACQNKLAGQQFDAAKRCLLDGANDKSGFFISAQNEKFHLSFTQFLSTKLQCFNGFGWECRL